MYYCWIEPLYKQAYNDLLELGRDKIANEYLLEHNTARQKASEILNEKYSLLSKEYKNQHLELKDRHHEIKESEEKRRKEILDNFENHYSGIKK